MTTFRTIIEDVLQDIGYLGIGDDLQPEDANTCLRKLNRWLDSLTLSPLALWYVLRTQHTLTSNTPSYSVGTGGDINIVRPDHLERAGLVININASPQTEIGITNFTDQQWEAIPQKSLTTPSVGFGVYYDRNWIGGLARLYPFPIPTTNTTAVVLYTLQALVGVSLDDAVSLPPGYELMLQENLAVLVGGSFGKPPSADDRFDARQALMVVKRANIRPKEARLPAETPGLSPGIAYDWRSDTYRER